jgi:hypothetical protein
VCLSVYRYDFYLLVLVGLSGGLLLDRDDSDRQVVLSETRALL